MKALIVSALYFILTFALLRFVVPTLLSAPDTIEVLIGVVAVVAWVILTIVGVLGLLQPKPQPKRRRKASK